MRTVSWKQLSLRQKITTLSLVSTIVALALSAVVIIGLQWLSQRNRIEREIEILSDMLSTNTAAALVFQLPKDAVETLATLRSDPDVSQAALFTRGGDLFAQYSRQSGVDLAVTSPPKHDGVFFSRDQVTLVRTIVQDREAIGTLWIAADLARSHRELGTSLAIVGLAMVCCVWITLLLARRWSRIISQPISHLSYLVSGVSARQDYTLRADKLSEDELGALTESFNEMLDQIQRRDDRLRATRHELEKRVQELHQERAELSRIQNRERSLQERLTRSEKMESLGFLAGGVAHDLNNILGPMVGYPDLMLDSLSRNDPLREFADQIKTSALRAAAIIQDLLTLARRGSYQKEPVRMDQLVETYLGSPQFREQQKFHPNVKCEIVIEESSPIMGSSPHLSQVVMNLILNALEAMGEGGTLKVMVGDEDLDPPHHGFETVPAGGYCVLAVRDTGSGIDDDDLPRIFEPFYTRKKMGRSGSGLGLAVVYGVVKDLAGFIDVHSVAGQGSTFSIYIPRATQRQTRRQPVETVALGRGERILVVDDEEIQRFMADKMITSLGYSVHVANGGQQALDYLRHSSADLVILDMVMDEGFDGLTTYRHMRRLFPDLRCIIASGYSENERVREALDLGAGAYIAKPYTRQTIGRAIRCELDREPGSHLASPKGLSAAK